MSPNLEISTVVGCRMNCDYCPQKIHVQNYTSKSSNVQMTFHDFKKILSTVPNSVEIVFAGMAEPWLNKNCTDMVLYAFDMGYKVGVYTTTVGMKAEEVHKIRGLPFLFFCLHLPDADGLMTLKVTEQYLLTLLMVMRGIPNHQKMVIGKLHPEVEKYTGPVADGSAGLLSRAGLIKTLTPNRKRGVLECSACGPKIDHNVVLPNGDVLLCCMQYDLKHVIGNLLDMDYQDLFKSDEYNMVMAGLKDESIDINCRTCELAHGIH